MYSNNFTLRKENLIQLINETVEIPELKNAILFLDGNNTIIDYKGVFFGCDVMEKNHDKIKFPETCDEKYTLLKDFFSELDIPTAN